TSCPVICSSRVTAGVSRVTYAFLCMHVVTNTPAGPMEAIRSYSSIDGGLPHQSLIVYSRRSTVGFAAFVGECQHVLPVHLVVQRIEAKVSRLLRFVV